MSVTATAGVGALGKLMQCVCSGEVLTVDALAKRCGVARSTAFDIIGQLEKAGFVERDSRGNVLAGAASIALGFARYGLADLHLQAEAVLSWLRDETDASVSLVRIEGATRRLLLSFEAGGPAREPGELQSEPIGRPDASPLFVVQLVTRSRGTRAEQARAALFLRHAATSLTSHLKGQGGS